MPTGLAVTVIDFYASLTLYSVHYVSWPLHLALTFCLFLCSYVWSLLLLYRTCLIKGKGQLWVYRWQSSDVSICTCTFCTFSNKNTSISMRKFTCYLYLHLTTDTWYLYFYPDQILKICTCTYWGILGTFTFTWCLVLVLVLVLVSWCVVLVLALVLAIHNR